MQTMTLERILTAMPASDGGGVKLYRIVGPDGMRGLDPFLLLDEFGSDAADDYIAGFPPHPHRGFETVTYMLEGRMLHEDHLGHQGLLSSGGVQWMTAGRGVIHSEMPQQESGRMHGLQLWINLPAKNKLVAPAYRHLPAEAIPVATLANGIQVKVIAGGFAEGDTHLVGAARGIATDPLYLDVRLPVQTELAVPIPAGHRALVYLIAGRLQIAGQELVPRQMAVLGAGDGIGLKAGKTEVHALVLAARPLGEPIAHHGPFVMNTQEEIAQAIKDYEQGRLVA
ncbi:hypothetical protein CCR95_08695 [Thiocystis minor]|uniref:pirin family protein n=1 Tax=Thiocystis minor TaxID=61597 RepID=UPI001913F25F|nr:pirin family protein [Thiocystis minor]MBK5964159.1 hypothetical protein [Thiocystis minor]